MEGELQKEGIGGGGGEKRQADRERTWHSR